MNVLEIIRSLDERTSIEIIVNNKSEFKLNFYDDLDNEDLHCIADLMKMAYEAGKNGENFVLKSDF